MVERLGQETPRFQTAERLISRSPCRQNQPVTVLVAYFFSDTIFPPVLGLFIWCWNGVLRNRAHGYSFSCLYWVCESLREINDEIMALADQWLAYKLFLSQ